MKRRRSRKSGQTMVEYIIIVVIVAIAAIAIFGAFSDTIQQKLGGAVETLGGTPTEVSDGQSEEFLKELGTGGGN